jgi:predicted enzyme related to lactoylglutathione lyase
LSYENSKWVEVLVSFDKVFGIAEAYRREGGMWVLVFPRDGRKCVGFNDRGQVSCDPPLGSGV